MTKPKLTQPRIKALQDGFNEVLKANGIKNHTVQQFALKPTDDATADDWLCGKGFCFVLDPSHPLGQCVPCLNDE